MFKVRLEDKELIFETIEESEECFLTVYVETGEMGIIEEI